MTLPFRKVLPLTLLVPMLGCGDDGTATADAAGTAAVDATAIEEVDAAVVDADTPASDAAVSNQDLVDQIADGLLKINTVFTTCEFGDVFDITEEVRACMKLGVSEQPQTKELADTLSCAQQGIAAVAVCANQQSCDEEAIFNCFDATPDCVDSPLLETAFSGCLDSGPAVDAGTPPPVVDGGTPPSVVDGGTGGGSVPPPARPRLF